MVGLPLIAHFLRTTSPAASNIAATETNIKKIIFNTVGVDINKYLILVVYFF